MLMIQDVLVSDEVVQEQFLCNLNACKGACCWEGDYGAPLSDEELNILQNIYLDVAPFLTEAGRKTIEKEGVYKFYEDAEDFGTPLLNGGACVYMTRDENGIAQCGIEQAYRAGAIDFQKPVSCHLYPLRISPRGEDQLEIINYERWDICSAACKLGKQEQMPVYRFVKNALIRKYGEAFYESLDATAQHLNNTTP
ncbi:MAG: DUF3109 family protein [Saprospiraceae bacterium]|nr:DUF3109 family protein [Saprospiraceae bacterium]